MNRESLNEMKAYLLFRNSAGGCAMFACGLIFAGMLACVVFGVADWNHGGMVMVTAGGVGALITGALLYLSLIHPRIRAYRRVKAWSESGELEAIVEDFANTNAFVSGDRARLGNIYLFGRGTGAPVKYEEIKTARIVKIRNNGVPLETNLSVTLKNGKSVVACKIPGRMAAQQPIALYQVIAAIRCQNPDFKME